jgi:hypothetical protein
MQFNLLMLAAAFAAPVLGKLCLAGWYGECEYVGTTARCATRCYSEAFGVDCVCPQTIDGGFQHKDTRCITLAEYNDRHKCVPS